ncbi:VirE2 family protein [Mesorhizobium sp. GbtcB19]|uniref:VirE2 family protein n=1 Tax=Mesorhizobium sp. GbtcB19 TaxID=2824764 RepID=UPI001C306DBC|nr:VirE2 family protein [Mesorhizobium sp. GbtcB19]
MENDDEIGPVAKKAKTGSDRSNNDADMRDAGDPSDDVLNSFSRLRIEDGVRRDAFVIHKRSDTKRSGTDNAEPEALTRGQWQDEYKSLPPIAVFDRNGYTIHGIYTGTVTDEHSQLPPQEFVHRIAIPADVQKRLNAIVDKKDRSREKFKYQAGRFREIAEEIGVPSKFPTAIRQADGGYDLVGDAQSYSTAGGIRQRQTLYDNELLSGDFNAEAMFWKGQELVGVAWRQKGGKFDGKTIVEAEAMYGDGVVASLKSRTQAYSGREYLNREHGEHTADRRWNGYVGVERERNATFKTRLTAIAGSSYFDVDWLLHNKPDSALTKGVLDGSAAYHLRVSSGTGNARLSVQFAMEKDAKGTTQLLKDAKIPLTVADSRPGDRENLRLVGEGLSPVTIKLTDYRDGPPPAGVNVLDSHKPQEILIANRDSRGERTGMSRTLSEYQEQKLRLPDDAAKELDLEPDVYSRTSARASRYAERDRDRGAGLGGY